MARKTDVITISLPPQMRKQMEEAMVREGRTRSELVREAVRRYIQPRCQSIIKVTHE